MLEKIHNFILDVLFPIDCLLCQREGFWICEDCFEKIKTAEKQVCPYCEKIDTPSGKACPRCKNSFFEKGKVPPIDSLIVSAKYSEKTIANMIHLMKYRFASELSGVLSKIMAEAAISGNIILPEAIIPVPLSPKRMRWRGFNQAELLADYLGQNLAPGIKIPVFPDLLLRTKHKTPQMKIRNYRERKRNVLGIFEINHEKKHLLEKFERILLVDDVSTTGATLFECGEVLRRGGAKKIDAIVIARQEWKKVV